MPPPPPPLPGAPPAPPPAPAFTPVPPALPQRTCPGAPGQTNHAGVYTVCHYCIADIRNQTWSTAIRDDVITIPGRLPQSGVGQPAQPLAVGPGAPTAYTRFLTHLCGKCENDEIFLLRERVRNAPTATPATLQTEGRGIGVVWPFVTCTCLNEWASGTDWNSDLCIRCRQDQACTKHNELLIMRQQNDKWLREIGRRSLTTRVVRFNENIKADRDRMQNRRTRGAYRACRCGDEVKYQARLHPLVYMCLGCEGVVHVLTSATLDGEDRGTRRYNSRSSANADMRLRRPL